MRKEKGVFIKPTLITCQLIPQPLCDHAIPESGRVKCWEVIDRGLGVLKIIQDAGVDACFGTDLLAGMHVFQNEDFKIRAAVMSNIDVLGVQ
jgi:hypothetical protein